MKIIHFISLYYFILGGKVESQEVNKMISILIKIKIKMWLCFTRYATETSRFFHLVY